MGTNGQLTLFDEETGRRFNLRYEPEEKSAFSWGELFAQFVFHWLFNFLLCTLLCGVIALTFGSNLGHLSWVSAAIVGLTMWLCSTFGAAFATWSIAHK